MQYLFLIFYLFLCINTALAGQYFNCDEMDHFSIEGKCENNKKNLSKTPVSNQKTEEQKTTFTKEQIEMWAEPTVDENGRVVSKLPPLPVLKALTDPSEENIKAYLEWNKKRMEAIEKASNALKQATAQLQGIKPEQIKKVEFYFSPT